MSETLRELKNAALHFGAASTVLAPVLVWPAWWTGLISATLMGVYAELAQMAVTGDRSLGLSRLGDIAGYAAAGLLWGLVLG